MNGLSLDRIYEQVDKVMASKKVDAIDINSGAMARVGMDALITAGALEARESKPFHISRRATRTSLACKPRYSARGPLGASATFLRSPATRRPSATIRNQRRLRSRFRRPRESSASLESRHGLGGENSRGATNFTIGVAVNPVADDLDNEIERFHAKVEAGAHFAMTQPLFDPEHWHAFLKKLGGKPAIPVMIGIWPLNSYKQALRLNNEVPGIVIPERLLKSMEVAGAAARDCGFKVPATCSPGPAPNSPART